MKVDTKLLYKGAFPRFNFNFESGLPIEEIG